MFLGEECAENRGSTVHGLAVHHPGLKHLAGRRPRRTGDTDGSWAPRGGASVIAHMSLLHCGISIRPMSALGHPRPTRRSHTTGHVRFASESRQIADISVCPLCAKKRTFALQQNSTAIRSPRRRARADLSEILTRLVRRSVLDRRFPLGHCYSSFCG